ncbi:hypothetical protein D3C79_758180 [compost metagenome]
MPTTSAIRPSPPGPRPCWWSASCRWPFPSWSSPTASRGWAGSASWCASASTPRCWRSPAAVARPRSRRWRPPSCATKGRCWPPPATSTTKWGCRSPCCASSRNTGLRCWSWGRIILARSPGPPPWSNPMPPSSTTWRPRIWRDSVPSMASSTPRARSSPAWASRGRPSSTPTTSSGQSGRRRAFTAPSPSRIEASHSMPATFVSMVRAAPSACW